MIASPLRRSSISLVLLLFCMLASSAFAGTVTGTVRNGTTGKPAAGVDMILIQLQGGMQPVANTKTDADGHYRFDHPGLGAGPMLIRAVYRGVNYHEPATPDKTTVDMQVFEPTDKPSAILGHGPRDHRAANRLGPRRRRGIQHLEQDAAAACLLPRRRLFHFLASRGRAAEQRFRGSAASGMPVVQSPIDKGNNRSSIAYPFRPGDSQVSLSYKLPYPGNQASTAPHFAVTPVRASRRLRATDGADFGRRFYARRAGSGIQRLHPRFRRREHAHLGIRFGHGSAPRPDNAAAAERGQATTLKILRSIRRIETGTEAPVASVTTLPARLDSLKWILVGGFVALFALGSIYVSRQPQAAVAEAASVEIPAAPPAPAKAPGSGQPAPYSSGAASAPRALRQTSTAKSAAASTS